MTPGARISAAIAVLDRVLAGEAAEKALVNWARGSRFAGSGDRAAVRDHVFDALRRMRSAAALGGAMTGRGLMLGVLRGHGIAPETLFTGEGHAPAKLEPAETGREPVGNEALDCPDWLAPVLSRGLGADFAPVMMRMQERAPAFLRVNRLRATIEKAITALAREGITARPHPLAATALEVTDGARKIAASAAFAEGLVELQDAASQAVVEALPLSDGMRVLDYCAGGGGKSLAMAARARLDLVAHDVDPRRMADLPARAKRAGAKLRSLATAALQPDFDLVLADAPCTGSGAWRRAPEARWRLDAEGLAAMVALQGQVIAAAAALVRPGGWLAYATCSMIDLENRNLVDGFLSSQSRFQLESDRVLTPLDGGDGFYLALMKAET